MGAFSKSLCNNAGKEYRKHPDKDHKKIWKWFGKNPKNDGIRIDKANPTADGLSQRVDHVLVRKGGETYRADGTTIPPGGRIKDYPDAHIPLSEWVKWKNWYTP